jgi:hypothetical protein
MIVTTNNLRSGIPDHLAKRIQPLMDNDPRQLEENIAPRVAKPDLPAIAAKNWINGFVTIQLNTSPDVGLRFQPHSVGLGALEFMPETISNRLMVNGNAQACVGSKPAPPVPKALPSRQEHIQTEAAPKEYLTTGQLQTFWAPAIGDLKVTFKGVLLSPATNDSLAIGVTLSPYPPHHIFSTTGTNRLTGRLAFDNASRRILPSHAFHTRTAAACVCH